MHRLPHRAVLSLTGPDTLALLERTVTHTVGDWADGEARYGALLTPQGKIIADYIAVRTADGVRIDVHEDAADDLVKRLKLFRLRADVEIGRVPGLAVLVDTGGVPDPRSPALPHRTIGTPPADAGLFPDWDSEAIAAGVPEWGADFGAAEVFPTDVNMDQLGGIDYRKGCFVGQEVASRMKRKATIRKRTIYLTGTGVTKGADVMAGAVRIGEVTRASGGAGLARVRTDRLAQAIAGGEARTCAGSPFSMDPPAWLRAELTSLAQGATADD